MSAAGLRALHGATIFIGALLLFLAQPILVRAILPRFGGSAGVWTAAMLFFQIALLGGYVYAWGLTRLRSPRAQGLVHGGLLLSSLATLPMAPGAASEGAAPAAAIVILLAAAAGAPYFLLSAASPLVQHWSARSGIPYRLYAVSNFGSLLALVLYPLALEPWLAVSSQMMVWSAGYAVFVAMAGLSCVLRAREATSEPAARLERPRWAWIALAACASALWLALAAHLTQDIAPAPLLWVLPLAIYLLTFVLSFASDRWYRPALYRWLLPAAWAGVCASLALQHGTGGLKWRIPVCAGALFVLCMFCHGELARSRPPAKHMAWYYVWVALGGALGALLVAVAAPVLFDSYLELPLAVAASIVLALALLYGYRSRAQIARLALVGGAAFLLTSRIHSPDLVRVRNFYGALRVRDYPERAGTLRVLYHGSIEHGAQFQDAAAGRRPTAYYGPTSGGGLAIVSAPRPARVGVVGLGVGALAAYARTGDQFRFYEINPLVIEIARRGFTFLRDSEGQIEIAAGDARLTMQREPPQNYDVLAIDAFTGDAVPVHLLTREAIGVYLRHLRADGILAFHITNKHLDLAPVIAASVEAAGRMALLIHSPGDVERAIHPAMWVLAGNEGALSPFRPYGAAPGPRRPRVWTDDYSDILAALR
jgi:hypothetical protein